MFDIRKIQEQVLFSAVQAASDAETAAKVVYGEENSEDNVTWVKAAMNRLDSCFDRPAVTQIRMNCQCGYGMEEKLAFVKGLVASSSSLEEFANQDSAKAAGLSYIGGELHLQFPFCPCPMLADVDKLDTDTWCLCTTGYSKVLFEQAFGCAVDVQLLKSIKMGHDICLMKIIPRDTIWK